MVRDQTCAGGGNATSAIPQITQLWLRNDVSHASIVDAALALKSINEQSNKGQISNVRFMVCTRLTAPEPQP